MYKKNFLKGWTWTAHKKEKKENKNLWAKSHFEFIGKNPKWNLTQIQRMIFNHKIIYLKNENRDNMSKSNTDFTII